MKIHTKAVHAGDRKKHRPHIPVTTPIHTASSFFYESMEQLDRIFAQEEDGLLLLALRQSDQRRARRTGGVARRRPRRAGLRVGDGGACRWRLPTALTDRRKSIVAANALYGATVSLLMKVLEPMGVDVRVRGYLRSRRGARGGGGNQARAAS